MTSCVFQTMCAVFVFLQEKGEGQNGAERGALRKPHGQVPFYLSRANHDQSVVKAGFCVKQGAVVSLHPVQKEKVPQDSHY